ncbi:unnamed protein product [marine sediment metagenome]|uniref:Uncharacterized protein n=1 Tax=marine sediment metagenome TaxID=412755 RepID=X1RGA5_9ZZZZ
MKTGLVFGGQVNEDMKYEEWRDAAFIAEEEEANITDMFDSLKYRI